MARVIPNQIITVSGIEFKSVTTIERGCIALVQVECDREQEAILFAMLGRSNSRFKLMDGNWCKVKDYSLEDGFVELTGSFYTG